MDNLLLAALKSETAPSRDAPSVRDRSEVGRDRDPSAFDRELNETARERRDARADRRNARADQSSERTERTRESKRAERTERTTESERAERAETARGADQAERADTDAADRTDDATADETRDVGAENTGSETTEAGVDKAGTSADSAREEATAATPNPVTTATKLSNLAKAVAEKLAKINGTAEDGETDTDAIPDPVVGPSAIAVTVSPAKEAAPAAAGLAVSPGTGVDTTPTDAAGRAKSAAGQTPLDIETGPDGKPSTGSGGAGDDGEDNRPGAKPGNAPERALAARAAFGIAGAERAAQTPAAKADFAQSLGASPTLDGITGDGLRQADTQTVTLRLTPVSHASKLSAVPVNTLAFHIARSFDKGINHFEIRLDPPELGRIDVRMEVDRESRVRVHLVVERPEALDFLQRDARALERALADAGLDADAESLSFSLDTGNPGAGGEDDAALGGGSRPGLLQPAATDDPALVLPTHYVSSTGVDIRV